MESTEHAHTGLVTLDHEGHTYTATYRIEGHAMTVITDLAQRTMPLRDEAVELQAREMLHDMIRAHEARPAHVTHHPHHETR